MSLFKIPDWIRHFVRILTDTINTPIPVEWVVSVNKESGWKIVMYPAVVQTEGGSLKTATLHLRLPETVRLFDIGAEVSTCRDKATISGNFAGKPVSVDFLCSPPDFAEPSFALEKGKLVPLQRKRPDPPSN